MEANPPRKIVARFGPRGPEEEEFDLAFWESVTPERRVEIGFAMVDEVELIRGLPPRDKRLQRSIERLWRRGS
jgi:hypothetical protein